MELRECPFCGAQPDQADVSEYYVECPSCGLQGPYGEKDTYESSIAAWNRRASPASVPAVTDGMALAFHRALTDGSIGQPEVDEIKTGLRAALAAAPTPPVSEDRWFPIETAPKDGIEVWCFNGEHCVMRWVSGEGYALWGYVDPLLSDADPEPEQPSHWMPLPEAPTMQEDKP